MSFVASACSGTALQRIEIAEFKTLTLSQGASIAVPVSQSFILAHRAMDRVLLHKHGYMRAFLSEEYASSLLFGASWVAQRGPARRRVGRDFGGLGSGLCGVLVITVNEGRIVLQVLVPAGHDVHVEGRSRFTRDIVDVDAVSHDLLLLILVRLVGLRGQ